MTFHPAEAQFEHFIGEYTDAAYGAPDELARRDGVAFAMNEAIAMARGQERDALTGEAKRIVANVCGWMLAAARRTGGNEADVHDFAARVGVEPVVDDLAARVAQVPGVNVEIDGTDLVVTYDHCDDCHTLNADRWNRIVRNKADGVALHQRASSIAARS